jgi:two-component system sensor histidine kinase KdpD
MLTLGYNKGVLAKPYFPIRLPDRFRSLMRHPLAGYIQSVLLVLLVSVISIPIHWVIEPVNLVMFYLAAVVVAAVFLGRGPAMLTSLLGVLAFDFFLVEPRLSFTVADSQYLLTFFGLLLVGLVISNTAALLNDQVKALHTREAHLDALNSLSRDLTRALSLEEMLQSVVMHVGQVFGRPAAILLPGKEGLQAVTTSSGLVLNAADITMAERAYQGRDSGERMAEQSEGSILFCLPLETTMGRVGVIGIGPNAALTDALPDEIELLDGFASLAALAIERARLSEQANQAKILENTERLQAALLSSISHELRTPLVSITGTLSTLAEFQDIERMNPTELTAWREMVDTAYEESQRLNLLVGNLLEMTRLEAGAFQLSLEPCDIQDLVGIALRRFSQRRSSHRVQVSLPDDLSLVWMDVALMVQVLLNLLDNAAKYSPENAMIEIQGRQEPNEVILTILDHGIGVPEADLPRIFDKFYRSARSRGIGGIGLGLSISKGIVEAHNGRIWAENRPAGGTAISLGLPIQRNERSTHG